MLTNEVGAALEDKRVAGRVVIVTGAGQGIGKIYAQALAAHGALVSLCDLADPSAVASKIAESGGRAISRAADVTDPSAVRELVAATTEAFGTVHVLVNNAAMFTSLQTQPFEEIPSEEWDRVMAVNTRGSFECARAVLPIMKEQGYGKIINISSGTVFKGTPMMLHYVSSKGAVIALTRAMARETGPHGISVNCIAPGLTESENLAIHGSISEATVNSRAFKRPQMPEDLVGTLIFLASADSDFITGQTIVVDGGSVMH
jgi:NAD(P)-dependent dehydrogenase (short-subunit alcohol dehydrogenase family)